MTLELTRGYEDRDVPGCVGRPCSVKVWDDVNARFSDWLPGFWLAWLTSAEGPVAIIETPAGQVQVVLAENVRFAPQFVEKKS